MCVGIRTVTASTFAADASLLEVSKATVISAEANFGIPIFDGGVNRGCEAVLPSGASTNWRKD